MKQMTPTSLPLRAAALALGLLVATPAAAEIALNEGETVFISGDVRLRGELDWDSRKGDGTERDDRERMRGRVRLSFAWRPNEHLGFLVRGRTGNTNVQQSAHFTFWQDGDKGDADVLIDRLWVKGTWSRGEVWAGRKDHSFWRQDEFLFDDDIWLDGLGFRLHAESEETEHELRGAFGSVPEGTASLSWDEEGWLYGLQYAVHHEFGEGKGFSAALSGIRVEDDPGVANPVLLDLDWMLWTLQLQGRLRVGKVPVTLGADLFHGGDAPPKGTWNGDERDGWAIFAKFGGLKKKGDWLAAAYYAHVEQFAVVPFLAQDDRHRWGSSGQTRSSNSEGLELRFGYAFRKDMNLVARFYLVEGIELQTPTSTHREDGKRFRVDFNWKF